MGRQFASNDDLLEEVVRLRRENQKLRHRGDIHQRIEAALQERDNRYSLLIESSPDAVILYNPEGKVLYVNPAFERIYGWSRQEWLGRRIDFVPIEEKKVTSRGIEDTLAGQCIDIETRRLTKDGRRLDIHLKTAPLLDRDGELAGLYVIHRDVTEKKANEAALRASEQRYRQLLEASPDPITVYDANGVVSYVNPSFEQTFGWTLEELAGRGIDFVPEQERQRTAEAVQRTLEGENVLLETQRLTKDGRLLDIQLKTAAFTDSAGNLAGDIVIYRDISERKKTEEALRASEQRYRQLLDASPDPITVYDASGVAVYVNPSFEQTFGWTLDELAGRGIDFVPEHERRRTAQAVQQTLEGQNVLLETQRLTKDGRLLDIQLKTAAFTDSAGNLAGDIVIYRDISRRKQYERELRQHRDHLEELVQGRTAELRQANRQLQMEVEERKRTTEALRVAQVRYRRLYDRSKKNESLYRSLFNSSPDAIVVYDMEGRVRHLNPSFTQIFGWVTEELEGRRLDFVPESEKEITQLQVVKTVRDGTQRRDFQTRRLTKDGRLLHVNVSGARYEDHLGNPAGVIVILRDTTERIEAQQERERLQQQLRQAQKMEAVGVLASGIAHDFNNILQAISGYLQMVEMQDFKDLGALRNQWLEVNRLVQRGADLVDGLLTFGRKVKPELKAVDFNHTIERTVRMLERTIPKMVQIQTDLAPDLWCISGDANQLEQMLVNLASNAQDAMPQGGTLVIKTRNLSLSEPMDCDQGALPPGDYVQLRVSDTGRGMDQATVEHIFEPFFTTKGVNQGTGLGLSTVYGIVKGHRGHIVCKSAPGWGTTFEVRLPARRRAGQATGDRSTKTDRTAVCGSETILFVDDEPAIREVGSAALSQFGYQPITAACGEEALEVFHRRCDEIDLVVLDLGMPGMGGLQCLRRILRQDPGARVIIASGYSDRQHVDEALNAGAAQFIAKPYRIGQMVEAVRQVIDGQT